MRLPSQSLREIEAAFAEAQTQTRARLVCVLAESSADHALVPVLLASVLALAAPWVLMGRSGLPPERLFLWQLGLFAAALALIAWTPFRVALAPRARRRAAGHRAALVQFVLRDLDRAPERNAVLIYVSLAERYARVIADDGLDGKVSQAQWRKLIEQLTEAMRRGERDAALKGAAARAAELLAPHFPATAQAPAPGGPHFHVM